MDGVKTHADQLGHRLVSKSIWRPYRKLHGYTVSIMSICTPISDLFNFKEMFLESPGYTDPFTCVSTNPDNPWVIVGEKPQIPQIWDHMAAIAPSWAYPLWSSQFLQASHTCKMQEAPCAFTKPQQDRSTWVRRPHVWLKKRKTNFHR